MFQVTFCIIERVSKKLGVTIYDQNRNKVKGEPSKKKVAPRNRTVNQRHRPSVVSDSGACSIS